MTTRRDPAGRGWHWGLLRRAVAGNWGVLLALAVGLLVGETAEVGVPAQTEPGSPPAYAGRTTEPPERSRKSPMSAGASDESEAGRVEEARADRELRAEQLRAAQELYDRYPRSHAAFVLGMVHNEQGDTESAIRYWREETRFDAEEVAGRDRAEAYANLADAYEAKGDLLEAAAMLRESLRLNPRRKETRVRLAHLEYREGRLEACLRVLDEVGLESPQALVLRGQAYQRLEKLDLARAQFEKAVRLDPRSAEAHYGLAMTWGLLGEETKAGESRTRFRALKAEQQTSGRETRASYRPLALTRRSLAQTHTHVGWVYLNRGRDDLAEAIWLRAAEVDPLNTAVRFQLVMLYQKARRNAEALRFAREMTEAEPRHGSHYLGLGNLYLRLKNPAAAGECFRKAVELAPDRPEAHFALAQFYVQTGTNLTAALDLARRAVELAPVAPHYYILSRAQSLNGDRRAAWASIARARELDPQHPQYRDFQATLGRPE